MAGGYETVEQEPILLESPVNQQAAQQLQQVMQTPINMPQVSLQGLGAEGQALLGAGMGLLSQLQALAQNPPEIYNIGVDYIKKILSGSYDPMTSPYYKGIRQEAEMMTENAADILRQGQQLRGIAASTPGMRAEAELRTGMNAQTLQTLGQLYESERNRMSQAGQQALAYANYQPNLLGMGLSGIGQLSPLATYGSDVANQQALANAQMQAQGLLAGYQGQLSGLTNLMDYGTYYMPQQVYQPGLLDYITGGLGAVAKIF